MALTSANKVITSALKTFQPVAIPSATMAITSASHKSGHSICHNKQTHQLSHMWLFHLLHLVKTSGHSNVVIPSTIMAISSANSYCGYNICHNQWKHHSMWFSSSTNKLSGIYICHNGNRHQPWHNYMANNICQKHLLVSNQKWQQHLSHPTSKKLAKTYSKIKHTLYGIYANIWQKIPTKIIKNNIPHTPTKVGVMVR